MGDLECKGGGGKRLGENSQTVEVTEKVRLRKRWRMLKNGGKGEKIHKLSIEALYAGSRVHRPFELTGKGMSIKGERQKKG